MTLSFITRWRDELPETYTALSPTPLNNARLIWHNTELANTLGISSSLFKNGAGVWGGETLLPGMSPLAQVYSGHQFGVAIQQRSPVGFAVDGEIFLLAGFRCYNDQAIAEQCLARSRIDRFFINRIIHPFLIGRNKQIRRRTRFNLTGQSR